MIFDRLSLVLVAAAALLGVIVSGAIHEMGHAVAAHAAGMHIIEIQPWLFLGSPHVSFTGSATNGAWAGIHCAGVVAATLTGLTATAISGFLVRNGSRWGAITWLFVPFLFQTDNL
jgi:hypothetical protein